MSKFRNFDWRTEAENLLAIREKASWKTDGFSSFSAYLKHKAKAEGVQISSLWRYLNAGSFTIDLQTGEWARVTSPQLVPSGISAESLELLEKISRVATHTDFERIAIDLYHGKLRRTDILGQWQYYRQALDEGQTARGRGVCRPVLADDHQQKKRLSFRQNTLKRLTQCSPQELGYTDTAKLIITNPILTFQKGFDYDAILTVINDGHVIDIACLVFCDNTHVFQSLVDQFSDTRLWLICQPSSPLAAAETRFPSPPSLWGLLAIDSDTFLVTKMISPPADFLPFAAQQMILMYLA